MGLTNLMVAWRIINMTSGQCLQNHIGENGPNETGPLLEPEPRLYRALSLTLSKVTYATIVKTV
jgi:hypothetical protein